MVCVESREVRARSQGTVSPPLQPPAKRPHGGNGLVKIQVWTCPRKGQGDYNGRRVADQLPRQRKCHRSRVDLELPVLIGGYQSRISSPQSNN